MIIRLLHLLRAKHLQSTGLRRAAAFEINAADKLFISRRQLLPYDEFVTLEHSSLIIQVCGLELNLVVREFLAAVAETDNPGRLRSGQFRAEFHVSDHNVAARIRPLEQCDEAVAILPYSENENDPNKK